MPSNSYPENTYHNENDLLQKVSEGNTSAFTSLVDGYWNQLYSHALAYVKNSEKAKEITQDVFLKIWQNRETLKEIKSFKNYLFIVGKNHIISAMRKKLQEEQQPDENLAEELWIPDKQLLYKEAYQKILQGIEKLPPVRQTIFKMSRLDGLNYHEIAEKLGISHNTVKGHIVLAISFLRNFIKNDITTYIFLISLINTNNS